MEVTGKIKLIKETETVGSNGFKKRDIVVTTDEQYPQHLTIQFVQDKCDLLNNFQLGQDVKISINLRGREWINPEGQAVYFNTIQGWRIEQLVAQQQPQMTPQPQASAPVQPQATQPQTNVAPAQPQTDNFEDDLPF